MGLIMVRNKHWKLWLSAGLLCILLSLTACAGPQPQQETTSPEVVQTQTVTEAPNTAEEDNAPTVGEDNTDIPNQDVAFGE